MVFILGKRYLYLGVLKRVFRYGFAVSVSLRCHKDVLGFQDDSGNDTKTALAMWAKDGEFVEFPEPCDCSGQVSHLVITEEKANVLSTQSA